MKSLRSLLTTLLTAIAVIASAQISTERVLRVGRNALYYEDYILAIQYFNQVIALKPGQAEPYLLRAIAKYNLDDFKGAETDATLAIARNRFLPDAWEVRAVARQNMGNTLPAIADYEEALQLVPLNRQILFNLAQAQTDAGLTASADSTFATLIREYPGYEPALIGRAQLRLQQSDTIAAQADIDRALTINPKSPQALMMRIGLTMDSTDGDMNQALADMDQVIRLMPDQPSLRINRAVIRYRLDDLNGALADFDYVINADPINVTALYNRALLRSELHDYDRALTDLNRVMALNPSDFRARYNRALIYAQKHQIADALSDINAVIDQYPDMDAGYSLRSYIHSLAGNPQAARRDAARAQQLAKLPTNQEDKPEKREEEPTDETVASRFNSLLTIAADAESTAQADFNAAGIRGRVQNQRNAIEIQPIVTLSFYLGGTIGGNDKVSSDIYVREVADLNATRTLRFAIYATNTLPAIADSEQADRHFDSARRYGSAIAAGNPRAIDFFGRAMDYMTLRNFPAAIADLDRALEITPDFALGYFLRSVARYRLLESKSGETTVVTGADTEEQINMQNRLAVNEIISDLDSAISLSPRMSVAYFNRGTLRMQMGQLDEAIADFTQAIELNPEFAAAWFNRGYALYSLGRQADASADISRAGQLGLHTGYSLLKQMQAPR